MVSHSAPMLCAVANGNIPGEDSWSRQDFRDGWHSKSRADRRFTPKARRTGRRCERMVWRAEVLDQLG